MAVARVALKNLKQKNSVIVACNKFIGEGLGGVQAQGWKYGLLQRLSMSSSSAESEGGKEVAVQTDEEGGRNRKWRSLLPRPFRKPSSLWRRKDHARDTHPFDNFPNPSLGNTLLEATKNMNKLFENVIPTQMMMSAPRQLIGKFKETDENYKLRYEMPGLTKDNLKVTVDGGVLRIRGERKVEEEDESDDEYFMSYGYYNTSLVLPDDAKQDDIKAELKDGVLNITIPKTESHGKDVKEIEVY